VPCCRAGLVGPHYCALLLEDSHGLLPEGDGFLFSPVHQMGRSLMLSLVTVMAILNGVVLTALTFSFR
jgi:hypothetical protein